MKAPLFGLGESVRARPFLARPDLCMKCHICVQACPTGALVPGNVELRHPYLRLLGRLLSLPLRRRYGPGFVFSREHLRRFAKNNFGVVNG